MMVTGEDKLCVEIKAWLYLIHPVPKDNKHTDKVEVKLVSITNNQFSSNMIGCV